MTLLADPGSTLFDGNFRVVAPDPLDAARAAPYRGLNKCLNETFRTMRRRRPGRPRGPG